MIFSLFLIGVEITLVSPPRVFRFVKKSADCRFALANASSTPHLTTINFFTDFYADFYIP
jgi:hypothetical protein